MVIHIDRCCNLQVWGCLVRRGVHSDSWSASDLPVMVNAYFKLLYYNCWYCSCWCIWIVLSASALVARHSWRHSWRYEWRHTCEWRHLWRHWRHVSAVLSRWVRRASTSHRAAGRAGRDVTTVVIVLRSHSAAIWWGQLQRQRPAVDSCCCILELGRRHRYADELARWTRRRRVSQYVACRFRITHALHLRCVQSDRNEPK